MHVDLHAILMVFAFVCFVLSALGVSSWRGTPANLTAAGLAFWALSTLAA
jgi:hypothetical protein